MTAQQDKSNVDVIIVGAGFAGLYMLHRARQMGLSALVFEAGSGVGGAWYWNRYPGLRCDVESMQYSYSFSEEIQQEWKWPERFSLQGDILRYLNFVADRLDLRRDIRFDTRVEGMSWDEASGLWRVRPDAGPDVLGRYCVLATGPLSAVQYPDIPGVHDFAGEAYHTAGWPEGGVDFAGKRVGVIGTGSSGVQVIQEGAKTAKTLHVFQRTPAFVLEARNRPLTEDDDREWKTDYAARRQRARYEPAGIVFPELKNCSVWDVSDEEREAEFRRQWDLGGAGLLSTFNDIMLDRRANDTLSNFVRARIAEIVKDKDTAQKLMPSYPIAAKRPPFGTGYYHVFNQPNVTLVDIKATPISRIRPEGVEVGGETIPLDMLVYATGYDAVTGAANRIDIRGRGGQTLKDKWADAPKAYLGIMAAGFPNLFLITGPGSPSILSNVVVSVEQHVEWVADCLAWLQEADCNVIDADPEAEAKWVAQVNEISAMTLYPTVDSWYVGANVPGKPRVFIPYAGGVGEYRKIAAKVAEEGYRGFACERRAAAETGARCC